MADNPKECGARRRGTDRRCRAAAMANGRCRIHGGASPGRPIVHGRYSVAHRTALAEKHRRFLADPRPADLSDELALTRALLEEYLERFNEGNPYTGADIELILKLTNRIGETVERMSRIINQHALTAAEVSFLRVKMAELIGRYLRDPGDRNAFLDDLRRAIPVPGPGPAAPA